MCCCCTSIIAISGSPSNKNESNKVNNFTEQINSSPSPAEINITPVLENSIPTSTPLPPTPTATQIPQLTSTPIVIPTSTPIPQPTATPEPVIQVPQNYNFIPEAEPEQSNSSKFTCNCSKTCTQISTCEEAQYQLNVCGCKVRDKDKDGYACDEEPLFCEP